MTMTKTTMTMTRRLTAIAFLTTFAFLPACGDLGSARVDMIAYQSDGSLVVFMATGIHVLAPSLDHETRTIPFDGLPVNTEQTANTYSISADGRVAAVSFSPPMGSTEKNSITLFDLTAGTRLQTHQLEDAAPLENNAWTYRRVFDLVLSPQGDLIHLDSTISSEDPNTFASREMIIDAASGAVLWTSDTRRGLPTFSADGTRLFVASGESRLEALDARTGASLYGVDIAGSLWGLSLTTDGNLAGIIDRACTDVADCAPSFGSWSAADLTLLAERPGRPQTFDYNIASPRGIGAAFACSQWNGLCALGLRDVGTQPPSSLVSVTQTDGTPVRELTVPLDVYVMSFAPSGNVLTTVAVEKDGNTGHTVQVFNVDDGTLLGSLSFDVNVP